MQSKEFFEDKSPVTIKRHRDGNEILCYSVTRGNVTLSRTRGGARVFTLLQNVERELNKQGIESFEVVG